MLRRLPWLMLVLTSLCFVTPALAQSGDREAARASFQSGVERFDAGDFEAALEAFQSAYRLAPHPSVRVNMANCYERMDRPIEALFNYERFVSEAGEGASEAQLQEVQSAIGRLQGGIGHLVLDVSPIGATVTIDGDRTHTVPLTSSIALTAGVHALEITMEGHLPTTRQVVIEGGEEAAVRVSLRRITPAEPVVEEPVVEEPVVEEPASTEASEDEFDEEPNATDANSEDAADGAPDEGELDAVDFDAPPQDDEPGFFASLSTPVLVSGSAAIVLTAIGIGTGVAALGADADFDDAVLRSNDASLSPEERADARQEGLDAESRANTLALVTDIMVAGAVVGAGVAVYFHFFHDNDTQPGTEAEGIQVEASPIIGPDSAGVLIQGSF